MNNVNLLAGCTIALAMVCTAAEPLPKNAGFETPNAKGVGAADWSLYGNGMWSVKRGEGRNGTSALICSDVGKGGWTTQWVEVEPGRPYRVEGWVRTEGVEGSGVCIDFSWHDAYGTRLGTSATQPRVMGTTAWTKVSLEAFVPPATAGGDYSFTKRRARHPAPQFAAGAVVKISDGTAKNRSGTSLSAVTVTFPPANAGKGRAYYYEVVAVDEEGSERITKRILSEGWCDPVGGLRYAKNVSCVFAKAELPKVVRSFRVRPVGFFGAKGRAIESGG